MNRDTTPGPVSADLDRLRRAIVSSDTSAARLARAIGADVATSAGLDQLGRQLAQMVGARLVDRQADRLASVFRMLGERPR